jgi:hypothetical protein
MVFQIRIRIKTNSLLRGQEKGMSLDDVLKLRRGLNTISGGKNAGASTGNIKLLNNMSQISDQQIHKIHATYGEPGLFKVTFLAMTCPIQEFAHFFDLMAEDLVLTEVLKTAEQIPLSCDNSTLRQSVGLSKFNSHILLPSFSRKLYNPGTHPGYLVYGLGGPRILVSHPFRGIKGEVYDVYNNSIDVVTSLMTRGYFGSFLFLDYLAGMNHEINGVPAWLVWFSAISGHSDLVLFVKEHEEDFGSSQRGEIEFTPDRVQKKIVEIPHHELKWAKIPKSGSVAMFLDENYNPIGEREYRRREFEHAKPILDHYSNCQGPWDGVLLIDGADNITEYPLDYPMYASSDDRIP